MAVGIMLETPKLYFGVNLVKKFGKFIANADWQAMTVPPGMGIASGIYFAQKKKDVKTSLFKHECFHWYDGCKRGAAQYFANLAWQYKQFGYKKAPAEIAANEYGKQPLTEWEQKLWDSAR